MPAFTVHRQQYRPSGQGAHNDLTRFGHLRTSCEGDPSPTEQLLLFYLEVGVRPVGVRVQCGGQLHRQASVLVGSFAAIVHDVGGTLHTPSVAYTRIMGLKAFVAEWRARRAGLKTLERGRIFRAARDIVGPTGWMWSRGWEAMDQGREAYVESFEDRLPPSLFVSHRDRTRHNIPIPLVERMIESHSVEEHQVPDDTATGPEDGDRLS